MLRKLDDDGHFERTAEAAAFVAAIGRRVTEGLQAFSAAVPAANAPKNQKPPSP